MSRSTLKFMITVRTIPTSKKLNQTTLIELIGKEMTDLTKSLFQSQIWIL